MRVGFRRGERASPGHLPVRARCRYRLYRPRRWFASLEAVRWRRDRQRCIPERADAESLVAPRSSIAARPNRRAERIGFAWPSTARGQTSHDEARYTPRTTSSLPHEEKHGSLRSEATSRPDPKLGERPAQHTSMSRTFRLPAPTYTSGKQWVPN